MIALDLHRFTYDDGAGLADISFALGRGERMIVVGASGSGKSTLARVAAGQFDAGAGHRFAGSLTVAGERLAFDGSDTDPRIDAAAWAGHVGFVGQRVHAQLSMVCATVAEEIAFGLANRGVPAEEMRARVQRTAERTGVTGLLERDPRRLSGGELQRVGIAAAVVGDPGVLVLDEPFKGLDAAGRRDVEHLLDGMVRRGTAVLQLEALLPAGMDAGGRVLVLSEGTVAPDASYPVDGFGQVGPAAGLPAAGFAGAGNPAQHVRDVTFGYGDNPVLSIENFELHGGEAVALLGPNGSGKSTLLQHLNGLLRPATGVIEVHGEDIRDRSPGSLAGMVGYLFQDSDQQLFERSVLREVSYGPRAAGRARREAERVALAALADVGIDSLAHAHPHDLCFRDRRLLALASLMAAGPEIWVLDEPTVGLDLQGREVLARLIRRHTGSGGAVVMATHDEPFAGAVCSRSVRLDAGTIVSQLARG